jgi:predicted nicotinamide N-methyase
MLTFDYELKIQEEIFGLAGNAVTLRIECLANLDEAIDGLFAELERRGETARMEKLCPYFGVVWPSARGLAEHLLGLDAGGNKLSGARVLEVGCGLAAPSLIAAKLGATVMATDFHPDIPVFLERNLALNAIDSVRFAHCDWQDEASSLGQFDFVIGSDILYDHHQTGSVARFLGRSCGSRSRVLIADPGRPFLQAFADEMQALGFVYSVNTRNVLGDAPKPPAVEPSRKDIFVVDFTKPE